MMKREKKSYSIFHRGNFVLHSLFNFQRGEGKRKNPSLF